MGEKKVKGRKRHLATDTLGNMLAIQVHAANVADTSQGWEVCDRVVEKHAWVEAFSGDEAYRGTTLEFVETLLEAVRKLGFRSLTRLKVSRTEGISPYEKRLTPRPLDSPKSSPRGVFRRLLRVTTGYDSTLPQNHSKDSK